MAKVIAICGKICSGKTFYARSIKDREKAVLLSCDEVTKALFDNDLGDSHEEMTRRIREYLKNKSAELVAVGCNVILDWGFWSRESRQSLRDFYKNRGILCEWHYVDVKDSTWQQNIRERNARVESGNGGSDYYLDEGLMEKLLSRWEEPTDEETDFRYER